MPPSKKTRTDIRREQAILKALGNEELPAQQIGEKSKIRVGHLYPVLLRLEDEGKISSHWDQPEKFHQPRLRLYKATVPPRLE